MYINCVVDAENLSALPVIISYCSCKEDAYYEEYKDRRILGFAFNAHIIYLKCNGSCGKTMKQSWHPVENSTGKFRLNAIHIE